MSGKVGYLFRVSDSAYVRHHSGVDYNRFPAVWVVAVEHDELGVVLLAEVDCLPCEPGDEDGRAGVGESRLGTRSDVWPVLNDDDESFEGRHRKAHRVWEALLKTVAFCRRVVTRLPARRPHCSSHGVAIAIGQP